MSDDYYVTMSTLEYFPGVPAYHSKDLVRWERFPHALTRPEHLRLYKGGTWAPSLSHENSTSYMTTAARWLYDAFARLFPQSF